MSADGIPVFGFEVRHETYTDYTYPAGEPYDITGWTVGLPHQCDGWDITGGDYSSPATHERAIALLRGFIEQAQAAMEALVDEREFGGER